MKLITYILAFLLILIVIDTIVHNINYKKLKVNFPKNNYDKNIQEHLLKNKDEYYSNKIPYNLFRTYIDYEKAKKFKKAREITLEKNPYLREIFFSDKDIENFIKDKYTERVYNAYQKINPIYGPAKADFFRYLVIYYYGGMYMDIKSYAHSNIKHLFDNENKLIVSKGRKYNYNPNSFGIIPTIKNNYDWSLFSYVNCGEYNNWHFIAPARHYLLEKVIKQIIYNIENADQKYNYGEYSVLALTGPILFSRVLAKYGNDSSLLVMEPNYNNTVKYNYVNHKNGNKNHYSKLKDKRVILN